MKLMKDNHHKKYNGSKAAIVFYVLAILFLVYGAYMIYTVYDYLVNYYASYSMGMWDDVANTLQYFVSNSSAYFVYAVLCYGVGMILQSLYGLNNRITGNETVIEKLETEEVENFVDETTIELNTKETTA